MYRIILAAFCLTNATLPIAAQELPPGIQSVELLPGWTEDDGSRVTAMKLQLKPGWKTYWRSPGDTGLPPSFDWQESQNLSATEIHWPTPEAIRSGDELTLGYHDQLVLPITAEASDPSQPVELRAEVELGVCEKICVPVRVTLKAPPAKERPDPEIEAALTDQPDRGDTVLACARQKMDDGVQLSVILPGEQPDVAVMEVLDHPEIWVSAARFEAAEDGIRATADFIAPSGEPFDLDTEKLLITRIGEDGATEFPGCKLQG